MAVVPAPVVATDAPPLIACEMCGSVMRRHVLQRDEIAACARCGSVLWRHTRFRPAAWLALALAAAIVFAIANAYPVATMSVQGMIQQATLPQAIAVTWAQNRELVAVMSALAGFAMPLGQILLLTWLLAWLAARRLAPGFALLTRALGLLRPWSMVPVFLLGVLVAVVKLAGMARVEPGAGLAGFAVLTVLLTMLGRLSPRALWRMAEQHGATRVHSPVRATGAVLAGCHVCGQVQPLSAAEPAETTHDCARCGAVLHHRKPDHLARTWALLIAACILYIPANVLPVMQVSSLVLGSSEHTILGGVIQLWAMGSWDLALIVFVASVAVPLTKLLALCGLLVSLQRRSTANLRQRTRLYQAVEFIGQWSMLDVFVVILLAALAHFQGIMEISAGAGAAAFGMVVVCTMLAAMSFDPRRSWDVLENTSPGQAATRPDSA